MQEHEIIYKTFMVIFHKIEVVKELHQFIANFSILPEGNKMG